MIHIFFYDHINYKYLILCFGHDRIKIGDFTIHELIYCKLYHSTYRLNEYVKQDKKKFNNDLNIYFNQ